MVEALEGLVGGLHRLPVVEHAVLGREGQIRGHPRRQPAELAVEHAGNGIQTVQMRSEQGKPPRLGYRPLYAMGVNG